MDHPPLTSPKIQKAHCHFLRHKGMYVMAEVSADDAKYDGGVDWAAYWCAHTQTAFGPDGEPVRPGECQGHRRCCE